MKLSELAEKLDLKLLTNQEYEDREVEGCYIGDLLSWVMSKAEAGDVWITVQTNVNIVAVAALADAACVLIPEGIEVEQQIIEKADAKSIVIMSSAADSYSLAVEISKLI